MDWKWLLKQIGWTACLVLAVGGPIPVRGASTEPEEPPLDDPDLPSPWVKSIEPRLWSGYRDNVLLGNVNRVGSAFVAGGLDLTFVRLPIDSWEGLILTSADYMRFLHSDQDKQEGTALVQAEAKRSFGNGWKTGLSAEYLYFNQVFDNSVVSTQFVALPVDGHGFTLRPSQEKDFGNGYRLTFEFPATRQIFGEFIDNYWEFGPRLTLAREYGNKSELALTYSFNDRLHDTREARDAAGDALTGVGLQFRQHEMALAWRHVWDAEGRWRSLTRMSLQRNEDNGEGYYSFLRPLVSEQLRYRTSTWEIRAEGRLAYYWYDVQTIDGADSPIRHKTYVRFNVRAERSLTKWMKVYLQDEYEQALSNLDIDQYKVNTIGAGLSWEF